MKKCTRCLCQGQPEEFMLPLATRLIGEFGKEKRSEHLVVAVIVGGVELRGLAHLGKANAGVRVPSTVRADVEAKATDRIENVLSAQARPAAAPGGL